jgi:hypothetical protein
MAHNSRQTIRTLEQVAARYNLTYAGTTGKGHLRWHHAPSGRTITSISALGNWRDIKNVERAFKQHLHRIGQQTGVTYVYKD